MAEDLNAIGHHPGPPTFTTGRHIYAVEGVPTESAWEGKIVEDIQSGDIYEYTNGAWVLQVSGGGGGGGAGLTYYQGAATDPNGVQVGNIGDVYKSRIALGGDGSIWWKETGNGTNTGWGE